MSEIIKKPIVTIEMENGDIIIADTAEDEIVGKCTEIQDITKEIIGLTFHRTIPGFMAQGGCPKGTGTGNPGWSIKGEFNDNGFENKLSHVRGVISMARSSHPDSAGSQFFIVTDDSTFLDGQYASFGSVIEGMSNVDKIVNTPVVTRSSFLPGKDKPVNPPVMKKVTVETFGIEYPEPEKY